ncbi:MAG: helix-turn-helix domain-containing protein [Ruminococcus sp.]|nr:helix-turn-helix domain-containing protein [Ruminococcus sp.]
MKLNEKNELIMQIVALLKQLIPEDEVVLAKPEDKPAKPEMLTIKECTALIDGLSEHTVRQLVKQEKVAYIRTGAGHNGKILVSKASLLKYLGIAD